MNNQKIKEFFKKHLFSIISLVVACFLFVSVLCLTFSKRNCNYANARTAGFTEINRDDLLNFKTINFPVYGVSTDLQNIYVYNSVLSQTNTYEYDIVASCLMTDGRFALLDKLIVYVGIVSSSEFSFEVYGLGYEFTPSDPGYTLSEELSINFCSFACNVSFAGDTLTEYSIRFSYSPPYYVQNGLSITFYDIPEFDDSAFGIFNIIFNVGLESDLYQRGYNFGYNLGYVIGELAGKQSTNLYQQGYSAGYTSGFIDGERSQEAYQTGYSLGYERGYNTGLSEGYSSGQSQGLSNPVEYFLRPVQEFLNIKLFGLISFGTFVGVVLFVLIAIIFIKMFAGG